MENIVFNHTSVLLNESIEALNIREGFNYVDCTTGGGGHSLEIARRLGKDNKLICFDRDETALLAAEKKLKKYLDKIIFVHDNYENIGTVLDRLEIGNIGGVLADLGCSSYQFDTPGRGFSYMHDAELNMKMDEGADLDAYKVVNTYTESDLRRIIFQYGEEKFASKIARNIIIQREKSPIRTTFELRDIIKASIPAANRVDGPHPAKRTFQAIRIEVNSELSAIPPLISEAVNHLSESGRIAIISFHSLEDRIVKESYKEAAIGCTCPKNFPVCICGRKPKIEILTKKPILPSEDELSSNPRSRSAKLRVAEKIQKMKEKEK